MWGQRSFERRANCGMICALEKIKNPRKKMIEIKKNKDKIWKEHILNVQCIEKFEN
jgi:hypothetical protein